ncbi:MAG TPA: beta-propeller fold lactonase family protein, partial [Chitinophagaceae bacterium]
IHLSPDGKFLYASNRDDLNDIAVYAVDTKTGKLTFRRRVASGGRTPRNFTLTPDGTWLLAGHQNSREITIFRRDKKTGLLIPVGHNIPVAHAVCLKMIPAN